MKNPFSPRANKFAQWGVTSLIIGLTAGALLHTIPQKNLSADLLNPTNSALPFLCSSVSTASSSNPGGNSPGNLNYGISMWSGVGIITPYGELGPTGQELATLSDSNVFEQRFVGTSPSAFAVGASDNIGEQQLTITCDTGTIVVYTPAVSPVGTNMRLYVAKDGSTYHSRADHNYSTWPNPPDLTPTRALRPEHLAKASPTYQADCYNTATITYSVWGCDGTTGRQRFKMAQGMGYNASTNTCSNSQLDTSRETELCSTGLVCVSNPPDAQGAISGDCVQPSYTVDDDFNSSTSGWGTYKFNSIQTAVDTVPDSTTVKVNPGTYTGNITITRNISLEGSGSSSTILDGGGSNTVLTIKGSLGTYSGFVIRNSGQGSATPGNVGIHINPSSATMGTYIIKDNAIYGNGIGIALWNGLNAQVIIQNNFVFRNIYNGIDNGGFGQATLINNTISDNGNNGYFDWVGKGPHLFNGNIIVNNGKYGLVTHRDSTPRTIKYNNVWNNALGNYVEGYSGPYTPLTLTPGTGEMSVDPQFKSRIYGDYSLSSSSPVIGKAETGGNMGANLAGLTSISLSPLQTTSSSSSVSVPGASNTSGLIGYWKFDGNGSNQVLSGVAAQIVGNASFKTEGGKYGGYAYIPSQSDWLKIPYNSIFDLPNAFTIEFWFRQRGTQNFAQDLVYKGNPINNYNFRIFRQLWNQYNFGPIIAGFTVAQTGYWNQTSNPNELVPSIWHHVVFTKSSMETAYYLDGVWIHGWNSGMPYSDSLGEAAKTPASDIIIGDSAVDTDIDNLRIYNRGMTKAEARSNGGFPPETTPTPAPTPMPTPAPTPASTGTYATGSGTISTTSTGTGTYATGSGTYATSTYAATTPTSGTPTSTSSQNTYSTTPSVVYETGTYVPGLQPQPQTLPVYGTGDWATSAYPSSPNVQPSFTPLPQEAPTALTRSLSSAEETLASFESFVATVDSSKVRQQTLDQAYNLIDEATYYVQQIRRAVSEGNLAHANRRLGLLQQVMADIKRTWEFLGRGQKLEIPSENFFSSENIVKEELATYGMQDIADQIAKIIMEKINFSEIVSQVVKQSSEILNKLLAYSTKHEETVSKTMDVLVTVDEKFHEEYLNKKVEVLEVVDRFDEKLAAFEEEKGIKSELLTKIDELKNKVIGYNFIGSTGEQMKTELEKFIEQFNDPDLNEAKLEEEIAKLDTEAEAAMAKAREEKFEQGAIPFKDTDDNEWFTQYVVPIQKEGIISGYKDAQGNSLGQFGPANNVTVAEILKIALESAELGQGEVTARLGAFEGHWAIGYVAKGKELSLTLLKEIENADQLNRPATRAEVVRVLLEVFNAGVDFEQDTRFEDAKGHKDEAYIEAARELAIIAGYDDGTFRPDASVNRAETSKIVNLVITSL